MNPLTRRQFIHTSALAAALAGIARPFHILRAQGISPNSKLRYAMIGPGGMGQGDFGAALGTRRVDCVAICDVYQPHAERALKRAPQAKIYADYRVMFDELAGKLDAVMISTCDHNHFGPAFVALQHKIPVFLQKPITHSFDQTDRLVAAATQAGVATQAGTQGLTAEGVRNLKEWVDAGVLGEIREIHAWCVAGGDRNSTAQVLPAEPLSPDIAWDLFLGPAPERPHNSKYYAGHNWAMWCDFSCGPIAMMGSHTLSALHYGVGLPYPEKIETWVSNKGTLTFPGQSRLTFHLPASGGRPAFKLFWYDGKDNLPAKPADWDADAPFPPGKPEDWDDTVSHFPANGGGALVIGSKASVILHDIWGMSCRIFPEAKFAELRSSLPPKTIPRYKGHHVQNWVDAITKKIPASSAPFELAGHVNNLCMLGSVATRVNRTLEFDAAKKEFTGDPEATALLRHAGGYEARGGFHG